MHARHGKPWEAGRPYVPDPLPKRICQGYADFLAADPPKMSFPDEPETDDVDILSVEDDPPEAKAKSVTSPAQKELDRTIEVNRMPSAIHRAIRRVVSEGEIYAKWHTDAVIADVPLLTWASRLNVVPLFYGDRLLAAAFVTERASEMGKDDKGVYSSSVPRVVWRHAEVHCDKRVCNVLYMGDEQTLGERVPLKSRSETAGYAEEWVHGLPILAFRIVNDLDDDDTLGMSDLEQIEPMLLALNRAVTGATENFDLTGVDRIYTTAKYLGPDGRFDSSVQVFQFESGPEATLGDGPTAPPIVQAEQHYDATQAWLHIANLVKTIIRSVGLVPQWVGEQDGNGGGGQESGVHRRLTFIPTTLAANGKMRSWQDELPVQMLNAIRIIALPAGDGPKRGGFGRGKAPALPPSVEFTDPLPTDVSETTKDVALAVSAEIMSRKTAIGELHHDWTDAEKEEELAEIKADTASEPIASGWHLEQAVTNPAENGDGSVPTGASAP